MRLWSISPSYLDQKGLIALWRESLLAQSVLLKGEYTECPRCEGVGWGLINKAKDNVGYNDCPKCKGKGKIKTPYYNHPQLERFQRNKELSLIWITRYLYGIYEEAKKRGYNFNKKKIKLAKEITPCITVTKGQLNYEYAHLMKKLRTRDYQKFRENAELVIKTWHAGQNEIKPHPLFKVIEGDIK